MEFNLSDNGKVYKNSNGKTYIISDGFLKEYPEKEFNLSEKIMNDRRIGWTELPPFIDTKHVKEFIRLDWELIKDYIEGRISAALLKEKRDKLAGEKFR